jgi:hypothetical protein
VGEEGSVGFCEGESTFLQKNVGAFADIVQGSKVDRTGCQQTFMVATVPVWIYGWEKNLGYIGGHTAKAEGL